jgi:spore germination cell wall hydrolase CwlJ-like protein
VPPEINDDEIDYAPIDYYYTVSEEEREMLARVTFLESGICSQECQRMVVSVIFNRLDSGRWRQDMNGDNKITLYDIVYYPAAFSPVTAGKMSTAVPSQSCYDAVDYVIQNGPTLPTYIRYFRAGYHFSNKAKGWETYLGYCDLDNVYFGYFSDWKNGRW